MDKPSADITAKGDFHSMSSLSCPFLCMEAPVSILCDLLILAIGTGGSRHSRGNGCPTPGLSTLWRGRSLSDSGAPLQSPGYAGPGIIDLQSHAHR